MLVYYLICEPYLWPQISYIISKRHTQLGCASLQCTLAQIGLKIALKLV